MSFCEIFEALFEVFESSFFDSWRHGLRRKIAMRAPGDNSDS